MYDFKFRSTVIRYYNKYLGISINLINDVKHIFDIASATLYNWLNLIKLYGSLNPKCVGRPINSGKINEVINKYIIKYFTTYKKCNTKNLRRSIKRIFNIKVSKSSIYGVLHKNNLSNKKVSITKSPYSHTELMKKKNKLQNELNITQEEITANNFNHNNVISFDESFMSVDNLTKEYGWAIKGKRIYANINGRKSRVGKSMLLAVSNNKTIGCKLLTGSVNGEHVRKFLMNDVIGDKQNTIILLDNARTHHYSKLKEDFAKTTNKLVYNVPYNPQSNPIEYINNVIKVKLKNQYIENIDGLEIKLEKIINKIPAKIYENCFNKAYKNITVE